MKILFVLLIMIFSVPELFARDLSPLVVGTAGPKNVLNLANSAESMNCLATKEQYQCAKMEEELEANEKYKIIQCDSKSLEANRLGNVSIVDCVWNGLKISGESLVGLAKLPGAIASSIARGFKDTQLCNASVDKKREMLKAFNLSIDDDRFKLSEQFLGKWLEEANCSEIEKLVSARYQNYQDTLMRERVIAVNLGKKPAPLRTEKNQGPGLLEQLNSAMKQAGATYNCYTPKVKAEMVCAGVTSLLADAALGGGIVMAAKKISMIVKSKKALANIERAVAAGEKADLKDSALLLKSERLKAAEKVLGRALTEEEERAVMAAHNIGKERGFGQYTGRDIADKARELKKIKTITAEERRALMENGITGTQGIPLKYGEKVRIAGEKKLGDAFEVGNKEKLAEGLAETKKYYEEIAQLKDEAFKKVYPADQKGILTVQLANEYGVSAKESAKMLDKLIRVHDLDAAHAYRKTIGSLSESIDEYTAMNAKKYSTQAQYKIHRAKELRAELLEEYYAKKYPDKYKELDFDKMSKREQEMLSAIREDLAESRKWVEKNKLPQ